VYGPEEHKYGDAGVEAELPGGFDGAEGPRGDGDE
jgi:hypothetical protein